MKLDFSSSETDAMLLFILALPAALTRQIQIPRYVKVYIEISTVLMLSPVNANDRDQ